MSEQVLSTETSSAQATKELAARLSELARSGDLVVLVGDLGAGKTAFTQGFAEGLGVQEHVTSPTFALVRSYSGRLDLHHLDVYRLEHVNEALDLGLAEMLDDDAVMIIEWGDTIAPVLPHQYLEIRLSYGNDHNSRVITWRAVGDQWTARSRALQAVVAAASNDGGVGDSVPTGTDEANNK